MSDRPFIRLRLVVDLDPDLWGGPDDYPDATDEDLIECTKGEDIGWVDEHGTWTVERVYPGTARTSPERAVRTSGVGE